MALVDSVLHVMTHAEWGKPISVAEKWVEFMDDNVKAKLPKGTRIEGVVPHGRSHWTRTAKISATLEDGTPASYFLKVSQGDNGRNMSAGEYASMVALYQVIPKFVPVPIGYGSYVKDPDIHFFVCELVNLAEGLPEMEAFCQNLAQLHHASVSPNGKFGFHVPTYKGTIPQYTQWHDTWEESFHHSLKWFVYTEEKSQGPDREMQELCQGIFDKVIPRLLRPMETNGRRLKPCLIHGDIWAGNCATNADLNLPVIFDGAALYAHNEMEMAVWRPARHLFKRKYMDEYFKYFDISEPIEDQDDRNLLYYLRWDLKSSSLFSGELRYRNMAKETMRTLLDKFPEGYEGWAKEQGVRPVQRVYSPTSYDFLQQGIIDSHETN